MNRKFRYIACQKVKGKYSSSGNQSESEKALFCITAYIYWVFKTQDLICMYMILKEKGRDKKKNYGNTIKPDYI